MTDRLPRQLQPDQLTRHCAPESFAPANPGDGEEPMLIGQKRAVRSVQFGLQVSSPGYNIFMAGAPGTGKRTFARTASHDESRNMSTPDDWCYVYNFDDPTAPWALSLPPGQGSKFQADMNELIEDARTAIRNEFEGGEFEKRRNELVENFQKRTSEAIRELEEEVQESGFALQKGAGGFAPVPLNDAGTPMSNEEYRALPPDRRQEIEERGAELQPTVRKATRQIRQLEKEVKSSIRDLERQVGSFAVRPLIEQLQEKYSDAPRVCKYLDAVHDDMIDHLDYFKSDEDESSAGQHGVLAQQGDTNSDLDRYKVNLLVNNAETEGAPVVEAANPSYYNLFGSVEYKSSMGTLTTDHTLIRSGALHRANGGFLILRIEDVLTSPFSWDTLKRSLKNETVRVENIGEQYRMVPTTGVNPEPIPLDIKIILIGSPMLHYLLSTHDSDFRKYFKIKADFDIQMERNDHYLKQYAQFVSNVAQRDDLLRFNETAVARIVDHSSRLAQDQTKLSARFNEVVEIVYESDAWARTDEAPEVSAEHVDRAVEERRYRSNLAEDHIREAIDRGKIFVDTEGSATGQINGLSVYSMGDYAFARPSRITANVYMGNEGVVNIERQIKMSGASHSKGVLILSSFISERFAYDKPLALSASITFEQSYGMVDGDSASCAELYAIISDLADIPLRQDIAVTGSVNQKGDVQPVGGINEKVEGFYYTCKAKGLNGEQGVIIPDKNLDNLMLNDEVIEAVKEGTFYVWTMGDVREGLELLSGQPAGDRTDDGRYPEDTVFGKADQRLREMALALRRFANTRSEDDAGEQDPPSDDVPPLREG